MINWKSIKVKDIGQLHNGRAFKPHEWSEQGLPIIRIQNLNGSQDFNYYEGTFEFKHEVNYEDLLFAWSGSRGTSFGPYIWKGDRSLLNQHIFKVELKEDLDKFFIYYMLKRLTSEIEYNAHGSAGLVHITKKELENFDILLPSLKEQQKIAEILSSVDAAIEKTEQVIAKTEEVKKGLMQQLLTKGIGHTEFSDSELGSLPNVWKIKRIKEVVEIVDYRGKTPTKTERGIRLITARNIQKGYIDYVCSEEYVSENDYNEVMRRGLPKEGEVLFTTEAPMGNVATIDNPNIALAQRVIKLNGIDDLNNDFLKYYLLSDIFQTQLSKNATGSTVKGIKGSIFKQLLIVLPSLDEQIRIVDILSNIDYKCMSEQEKLSKLISLKNGLMQQLLTGQVRVKID